MRYQGKIISWEDDRGFGFVRWHGAQDKLFVHISAFPGRRRPVIGDVITYEVSWDADGRASASDVVFSDEARRARRPPAQPDEPSRPLRLAWLAAIVLIGLGGVIAWWQQTSRPVPASAFVAVPTTRPARKPVVIESEPAFRCEGKTRCPQMSSCEEAEFYLRNCPGTEMDGDNDGRPCEQQFCGPG